MDNPRDIAYYINTSEGETIPVPLQAIDGAIEPQQSIIRGRKQAPLREYVSPLGLRNFPGIPYEQGVANPVTYFQGEDAIFDTVLCYEGMPVEDGKFDISVVVKADTHATQPVWKGSMNDGIYPKQKSGCFEIWVPSSITSGLFAGSYYLDVMLKERVGTGKGPKDRTIVLLTTIFNIEYSASSPNPETASSLGTRPNRNQLENTWPNGASTIGNVNIYGGGNTSYDGPDQYPID